MNYNYIGALHIHSTYSDGSQDINYIIKQAKKAGLQWIIITDHNTLEPLKHEGFYGNLCVIAGTEITPPTSNHLLAFNTTEVISEKIEERKYIDEVHAQGGVCFAAHPDESIHRLNPQKPLRWNDWSIDTFDGLEIWNYLTDWTDNYSAPKNKMIQYFNRHNIIKGPTKDTLAWWDRLNKNKSDIVPGICGLDAHSFPFGKHGFLARISDYYDYFNTIINRVSLKEPLAKDFDTAKQQIIQALQNANNIIINRKISKNTNIEFYAQNQNEQKTAGEELTIGKYSKLVVTIPKKATIRIILDGLLIYEQETKVLSYDKLNEGKYRIEIYHKNIPWIFTNPIKISKECLQ